MRLSSAVAASALGAAAYWAWHHRSHGDQPLDEQAQPEAQNGQEFWAGGPVEDAPRRGLSPQDEIVDQSFPASDPPANY